MGYDRAEQPPKTPRGPPVMQTSPGALTTARTEAVSTGFATARGPEATSFLQGGLEWGGVGC